MKYEINFNGKIAKIEFSDDLTTKELKIVVDSLTSCLKNQMTEETKFADDHNKNIQIDYPIDAVYPALTVRTYNILKRANLNTIKDVLNCSPSELMKIQKMGAKNYHEVIKIFSQYGNFKEDE